MRSRLKARLQDCRVPVLKNSAPPTNPIAQTAEKIRPTRSRWTGSVRLVHEEYRSWVAEDARELIAELCVPMAAARIPAITSPANPAGR